MTNPHGTFIWYELMTADPAGARRFYEGVVGWRIDAEGMPGMDYRIIHAGDGQAGGLLTLNEDMRGNGARPAWIGYIGVDDVDRSVAAIEARGGRSVMPAFDIPGVGRLAMVADPNGAVFYVMRGASPEDSKAFARDTVGHCAWNELATDDPGRALAFYTDLFDWTDGGSMPMGEAGAYQFLNQPDGMIGAISPVLGDAPHPVWTYYFRVADIDRAAAQMAALGGKLLHGPHEVPGGDFIIIGQDTEGATCAFVGARPHA